MSDMTKSEGLLAAIGQRGAILYGAGYVAETLHAALVRHGTWDRVVACFTTTEPDSPLCFHGLEVHAIGSLDEREPVDGGACGEGPIVCIAAHHAHAQAMAEHARECGFANVVWVYPLLHELLYGKPLRTGIPVPTRCILEAQPEGSHWVAARGAALAQRYGFANCGEEAYVKCLSLHCGEQTARLRLEAFRTLAERFEAMGADALEPILVNEDLRVVDGLHRLALAAWHGVPEIACDVVSSSSVYDEVLTNRNKLDPPALDDCGLDAAERLLVERLNWSYSLDAPLDAPEVSVVMPAYNVEAYIDECFESLRAQTFGDFEVILVNDGSTDGTARRCREWAERDPRVRFLDQENRGVSAARNRGIDEARGTYLAFVDPDDWLDPRYLQRLHERAIDTGADFVECDIWRYNNRTGAKIHRYCGQRMGVPYTLEQHMKYGPTASYKSLSRTSLWREHGIRFPSCSFESPAVYALVLAVANHIDYLPEPLYYYRRFRENSLIETGYAHADGSANNTLGIEAMEHLIGEFRRLGLHERFRTVLPGVAIYRLNDILAMQFHRKRPQDFRETVENFRDFVSRSFPHAFNSPYVTWGGYNLGKIMQEIDALHDPSCRFSFSSLVSLAGESDATATAHHANRYREMMVQRELDHAFWRVMHDMQPRYLVIDLVEERFDIVEWQGRHLTKSDAFDGAWFAETHEDSCAETDSGQSRQAGDEPTRGFDTLPNAQEARVIPRSSSEAVELFRSAITHVATRLREQHPTTRVIVVENYLAEEVGDLSRREPFTDIDGIRTANTTIRTLYDIVCETIPEAVRIRAYQLEGYFTDRAYEYGAVPSHLNAIVNERIARLVEKEMQ